MKTHRAEGAEGWCYKLMDIFRRKYKTDVVFV